MSQTAAPHFGDESYDELERAVLETPRGRWFLSEFARRNRTADTHAILAAIERLEQLVYAGQAGGSIAPPAMAPAMAEAAPAPAQPIAQEPPPAPATDTPIDALMARLTQALEETNKTMKAEAEMARRTELPDMDAIDALSPDARLRLFY